MGALERQEVDKYERRRIDHLKDSVEQYGEELGSAFAEYTSYSIFHLGGTEQERIRDRFAEVIVKTLEGSHDDRTKAVSALLKSMEKIGWDTRDLQNPPY